MTLPQAWGPACPTSLPRPSWQVPRGSCHSHHLGVPPPSCLTCGHAARPQGLTASPLRKHHHSNPSSKQCRQLGLPCRAAPPGSPAQRENGLEPTKTTSGVESSIPLQGTFSAGREGPGPHLRPVAVPLGYTRLLQGSRAPRPGVLCCLLQQRGPSGSLYLLAPPTGQVTQK